MVYNREQKTLAAFVKEEDDPSLANISLVGGTDISFVVGSDTQACASLVVLRADTLEVVYEDCEMVEMSLPYIPGFLAFREASHLERLVGKLRASRPDLVPQVLLVDGNGVLHPRRTALLLAFIKGTCVLKHCYSGCGVACHLGIKCDIPTIGVGKKFFNVDGLDIALLRPRFETELLHGGDSLELKGESGRVWGRALRTADGAPNPVFVSVGHRVSIATATSIVARFATYRVPEPIRQADIRSRARLRDL